jgi:hypothetical protein
VPCPPRRSNHGQGIGKKHHYAKDDECQLKSEAGITRRKACVLLRGDPMQAVAVMDAMDYDVHLFTDAGTGASPLPRSSSTTDGLTPHGASSTTDGLTPHGALAAPVIRYMPVNLAADG